MSYAVIQNFKPGLDYRRDALASVPGALMTLNNCHINQGGEIEKRKAFKRTALPAGTFGLLGMPTSLLTFGSIATPTGFPVVLPNGKIVNYQRLQHPNASAMTSVVSAVVYSGKAFVVAAFEDGMTLPFYDGTLIPDYVLGLVLPYLTGDTDAFAAAQAAFMSLVPGWSATAAAGTISLTAPVGANYDLMTSKESTSGIVTSGRSTSAVTPVNGKSAIGSITITANSGGTVTDVYVTRPGEANISLFNTATPLDMTGIYYKLIPGLIATAINAYVAITPALAGWSAAGVDNILYVYAPETLGATANTYGLGISTGLGSTFNSTILVDDFLFYLDSCVNVTEIKVYVNSNVLIADAYPGATYFDPSLTPVAKRFCECIVKQINAGTYNAEYWAYEMPSGGGGCISRRSCTEVAPALMPRISAVVTTPDTDNFWPGYLNPAGLVGVALNVDSLGRSTMTNGVIYTGWATAMPIFGTPPYTYQWYSTEITSGTLTITTGTKASIQFWRSSFYPQCTGKIFCKVTDATGKTATSVSIPVDF